MCPTPGCKKQISMSEIREHIGEKVLEELDSQIMNNLLNESKNLIKCKCGNIMEFVEG
jgi:hypothetical protein